MCFTMAICRVPPIAPSIYHARAISNIAPRQVLEISLPILRVWEWVLFVGRLAVKGRGPRLRRGAASVLDHSYAEN